MYNVFVYRWIKKVILIGNILKMIDGKNMNYYCKINFKLENDFYYRSEFGFKFVMF